MPAPTQRRSSQTISAFSDCASPNEDWTKLSDFEERRRVQSRIAQRNYRMKQKQRPEKRVELSLPTPESTQEELDINLYTTLGSASDLSHTDSQQQEVRNLYDTSTPETPQQQCPSLNNDFIMPLDHFTPQLLSSSGTGSCLFHTGGQQQPTYNFNNNCSPESPQQQCLPSSDNYVMPLQQFTPQLSTLQPLYSSSGTASCLFHTGGHQQSTHNFDNHCAPSQPLNHDCLTHQFSTSQRPCACAPNSGSALCHSQPGSQQ